MCQKLFGRFLIDDEVMKQLLFATILFDRAANSSVLKKIVNINGKSSKFISYPTLFVVEEVLLLQIGRFISGYILVCN